MPRLHALPNTRFDFFSALAESELLSPYQFAKADGAVPESVAEARSAALLLVNAKFLTSFQAERILAGRADGFVLGQHVIQEQVGKGSVGRVYRAVHRAMNRTVAIKVLDSNLTRTDTARTAFQREIRAAARLNHPNIITAYDANEVGGRSYLVLEFVDGPTLEAVVRERGPLPWPEACEYTRQVALGLAHAHVQGMVHRDIKPANLLVARASSALPECVVKIADFGLAKFTPAPSAARPAGGLTGTADFVSPEQAFNPTLADHRADLYSLGCVLYFLLAGRPPFHGGDTAAKIRRHQVESPAPIQSLRPDVPQSVVELLNRLLAKDPNHRPQAAEDVASLLSRPAAEAMINLDLPAVQPGPYSFASPLSGIVAGETSPWSQLTDEAQEGDAISTAALDETPSRVPKHRGRPRRRGLPGFVVLSLCLAVVAASALGFGVLLKLIGK